MAACLAEYDWTVEVGNDGGYSYDVPEDQREAIEADEEQCREETGYNRPDRPFSEAEAEEIYDYYLEAAECVTGQGFEGEAPPSREVWVETFLSGAPPEWDPYTASILAVEERAGYDIYEHCPHPLERWQRENL